MKRLLPYRVTDEHNVVNMFALADEYVNDKTVDVGLGDEGVFVKIVSGNLNSDLITYSSNSYLGKTAYPHVHDSMYPSNPLRVAPASSGDGKNVLGVTLRQTAKFDENDEKLLYNPIKKEETFSVLPGESVPILRRGTVTLSSYAFDGTLQVGSGIKLSANSGKVSGCALTDAACFGVVLGTGSYSSSDNIYSGSYAVVEFGF